MKNIHVLPTDKPSRLLKTILKGNLILSKENIVGSHWENFNLYITTDEEIKEGDYFLYDERTIRYKTNGTEYHGGNLCHISGNHRYPISESKKIILTTNPDLIKDGVQAIDDEFLEWFVKNPSCESVEDMEIVEISSIDANYIPHYQTKEGQLLTTKFNVEKFKK